MKQTLKKERIQFRSKDETKKFVDPWEGQPSLFAPFGKFKKPQHHCKKPRGTGKKLLSSKYIA